MIERDSLADYLSALGSKSSTPGGGAAAAITGAEACALIAMVCRFTPKETEAAAICERADDASQSFLALADEDIRCFNEVMAAWRSPAEKRKENLAPAIQSAAEVGLDMMTLAASLAEDVDTLRRIGNPNLITDTGIAARLLVATIASARLNVLINLRSIEAMDIRTRTKDHLDQLSLIEDRFASIARDIETSLI